MYKKSYLYLLALSLTGITSQMSWAQAPHPGAAQTPTQMIAQDLGKGMPERWTPGVSKEIAGNLRNGQISKSRTEIKTHEIHSSARAHRPASPQVPAQPALPTCAEQMPNMDPFCAYTCAGQYTDSMCHRMRMPEYICGELKLDCLKECIIDQEGWLVEES